MPATVDCLSPTSAAICDWVMPRATRSCISFFQFIGEYYRCSDNFVNRRADGNRVQNSDMVTFGQRLRAARKKAKLSQAVTAKKAGMSQSTLSELENDEYPTSTFTTRLAHIYAVSARWLADGDGPMATSPIDENEPEPISAESVSWPFSDRIRPEAYALLDPAVKEDIEDYIELKLSKVRGTPRKSTARKARTAA